VRLEPSDLYEIIGRIARSLCAQHCPSGGQVEINLPVTMARLELFFACKWSEG
jgi:hypothetical protein